MPTMYRDSGMSCLPTIEGEEREGEKEGNEEREREREREREGESYSIHQVFTIYVGHT